MPAQWSQSPPAEAPLEVLVLTTTRGKQCSVPALYMKAKYWWKRLAGLWREASALSIPENPSILHNIVNVTGDYELCKSQQNV